MGMSKVFGGMQHCRIAQCHTVKITITDEAVPVQVDGEAWFQDPGIIHIIHKNRVAMLIRDRVGKMLYFFQGNFLIFLLFQKGSMTRLVADSCPLSYSGSS